jgi:hypothetical protein
VRIVHESSDSPTDHEIEYDVTVYLMTSDGLGMITSTLVPVIEDMSELQLIEAIRENLPTNIEDTLGRPKFIPVVTAINASLQTQKHDFPEKETKFRSRLSKLVSESAASATKTKAALPVRLFINTTTERTSAAITLEKVITGKKGSDITGRSKQTDEADMQLNYTSIVTKWACKIHETTCFISKQQPTLHYPLPHSFIFSWAKDIVCFSPLPYVMILNLNCRLMEHIQSIQAPVGYLGLRSKSVKYNGGFINATNTVINVFGGQAGRSNKLPYHDQLESFTLVGSSDVELPLDPSSSASKVLEIASE